MKKNNKTIKSSKKNGKTRKFKGGYIFYDYTDEQKQKMEQSKQEELTNPNKTWLQYLGLSSKQPPSPASQANLETNSQPNSQPNNQANNQPNNQAGGKNKRRRKR